METSNQLVNIQYDFDLNKYISREKFAKLEALANSKRTPFLALDLDKVSEKYDELRQNFPFATIYYAVKANPIDEVVELLRDKGSHFDIASVYEMEQLLRFGVPVDRMSYGNTIKKERDIAHAYRHGIRLYATDSIPDLEKIARAAPGSKVFFRIFCDCKSADWPLSRKFGVDPSSACVLARRARDLGLIPYGLSFHVGSQQRDMTQWDKLIGECAQIFAQLKSEGIELKLMNMGGGLPANYFNSTPDVGEYASSIKAYLAKHFPDGLPEIVMEPGRSLVGDSGVIVAEVVLVSMKDKQWVYLDVGKFGGLIETISESITYPIYSSRQGKAIPVALAGPTCDSADVLYESYILPEGIREGDRLYIFTTGAYTQSYSAVEFNGFPELKYHFF